MKTKTITAGNTILVCLLLLVSGGSWYIVSEKKSDAERERGDQPKQAESERSAKENAKARATIDGNRMMIAFSDRESDSRDLNMPTKLKNTKTYVGGEMLLTTEDVKAIKLLGTSVIYLGEGEHTQRNMELLQRDAIKYKRYQE